MSLFGTGRREAVLAVLLLVGLALVQHGAGIFSDQQRRALPSAAVDPGRRAPSAESELAVNEVLLVPAMQQAGRVAATGELPVWNPTARFGEPFAATGAPVLYPPFWLLALPDGARFLDLLCWLHAALAGVFGYRFLRAMPVSRYAACVGAGSYALGWFATVGAHRLPEAAAASLLPWVLECTWRCLFARRRTPPWIGLAIGAALLFATGGIATATLGAVLATLLFVVGLGSIDRADRTRATGAWLTGSALAALLVAPLWLDALQHGAAFAAAAAPVDVGVPITGLAALLVPGFFGEAGGAVPRSIAALRQGTDPIGYALYPGALALAIALLAILRPKRNLLSLFWVAAAGIALCMSIQGEAARLLTTWLPEVALRPGAALGILHLALATLVALGLEGFLDAPHQRTFALPAASWVTLTACLAGLAALALPVGSAADWLGIADGGAAWAHLRTCAWLPLASATAISIALLAWRRLGILRLKAAVATIALGELVLLALLHVPRDAAGPDAARTAHLAGATERVASYGFDTRLPANWIAASGVGAVDADGSAILDRTARYLELIDAGVVRVASRARVRPLYRAAAVGDPLLPRAGVGALLAVELPPNLDFVATPPAPGGAGPAPGTPRGAALLHRASHPVERVGLRFDARVARSADAALQQVATRPPAGAVVVETDGTPLVTRPPRGPVRATIERETPTALDIAVDVADGRGVLRIADAFAPGWVATVDGEATPLLPADVAFRAVAVDRGRHLVQLRYRPWSLHYGFALQAFALVVLATLGLAVWRGRRG